MVANLTLVFQLIYAGLFFIYYITTNRYIKELFKDLEYEENARKTENGNY
jgi:hypothetical protein